MPSRFTVAQRVASPASRVFPLKKALFLLYFSVGATLVVHSQAGISPQATAVL